MCGKPPDTLLLVEKDLDKGPAILKTSLVAQLVKNLPAVQETPIPFLGWDDPLEKE